MHVPSVPLHHYHQRNYDTGLYDAGGTDQLSEHVVTWGGDDTWTVWQDGEPSNTLHLCVEDRRPTSTDTFEMNDIWCSNSNDYICKYSK